MKKSKNRYKWLNVILSLMFIVSCLDLGYVFLKLCFSAATLSWFGVVTTLLSLSIFFVVGEYLYDEMQ